jgi:hypothetical protein
VNDPDQGSETVRVNRNVRVHSQAGALETLSPTHQAAPDEGSGTLQPGSGITARVRQAGRRPSP